MKPLLIHLHLFYQDQWQMLTAKLAPALALPHELHVTMVEHNEEIEEDAKNVSPSACVHVVPNRGFDVAPFLHVLSQVNLNNYSYVIKIHSKRDMPHGRRLGAYEIGGARWREYLLKFLEPQNFSRCLTAFEQTPTLGMVADYRLIQTKELYDEKAAQEAEKLLFHFTENGSYTKSYIAGTMFMCRAILLQPIQQLNIQTSDFEEPSLHHISTLAHSLERLMGYAIGVQSFRIDDPFTPQKRLKKFFVPLSQCILRCIYHKKETSNNHTVFKILGIPFKKSNI